MKSALALFRDRAALDLAAEERVLAAEWVPDPDLDLLRRSLVSALCRRLPAHRKKCGHCAGPRARVVKVRIVGR